MNYMDLAIEEANKNYENDFKDGGPFGAVIVKDGKVISSSRNTVLSSNDPTAHAEINAIRSACKELNTHDLSGCILYTNCYPCPMCFASIIWANIKEIYYGNTKEDAENIGFRDNYIYEQIKNDVKDIKLIQMDRDKTIETFNKFNNNLY